MCKQQWLLVLVGVALSTNIFGANAQNTIAGLRSKRDSRSSTVSSDAWSIAETENRTKISAQVGILIPHGISLVDDKFGYSTSGGAVSLAIDRVVREGLLSQVEWRFSVGFSQCHEATAVGELIKLVTERKVNVIIGPPCSIAAVPTAVLAKFYNVPMFSWASTSVRMAEARYTTLVRVISSSLRLGRALRELLTYFNWSRFGMLFTDDKATRICYNIGEGVRKAIAKFPIVNVYNMPIDAAGITDTQIEAFLTALPNFARVSIVCMEGEDDNRRFMLRAQEMGMAGPDYVWIMPDYVRDMSRSELWSQFSATDVQDTRDAEAKLAFQNCFFLEAKLAADDEVHYFKKQIIERIKEYPFYYNSEGDLSQQYGALYSPFLHDAVYLYAYALNKTVEAGGDITTGSWIMNMTRGAQFLGASGHVVIDETGGREPNFVIRGFDANMKLMAFAEALMYKQDGDTIHLLVPERMIWESRRGIVPIDTPACGFYGELCKKSTNQHILMYVLAGAVTMTLVVAIVIILLISCIRKSLVESEMSKLLWKIPYNDLVFIGDKKRTRSVGSANTISTQASDDTQDAIAKGYTNVAHYRAVLCWVREHNGSMVFSSQQDHEDMKAMRDIFHDNINLFHGLVLDSPKPSSVWKYQSKGSLEDVLHNDNYKLDWFFKYSLLKDLANGMEYLHTMLGSMGRLRSSNCLIDQAWQLKVTDYGLNKMRTNKKEAKEKLWTAPEFLRMLDAPVGGSMEGDVYSFAIVIQEVLCRDRPFCNDNLGMGDCILRVAKCESPPFRPTMNISNSSEADPAMIQLMNDCWKEDPSFRPTFHSIKSQVRAMGRGRKINLMDHALKMMEKFTQGLEQTIVDRNKQVTDELKKADTMVYQLLPKSIADKMKSGQICEPERFDTSTVIIVEMGNFDEMIFGRDALQCVDMLNDVQHYVNETINKYEAYRVESLGSGVIGISGVPDRNGNQHAQIIADLALNLVTDAGEGTVAQSGKAENLQLRIGVHSGPVTAGVAGTAIPRFCVFGPTIEIAERLEQTGKISCIHMSEQTHSHLMDFGGGYVTKARGEIVVKGHGVMFTYWLLGKSANTIFDNTSDTTSGRSVARTSNTDVRSLVSTEGGGDSRAQSRASASSAAKSGGED